MNYAVAVAMFGWIPVILALFFFLPQRRAALTGFLLAWMFLPSARYNIPGLPDYTKMSATCGGVLLGVAIFDFQRLISLRMRVVDLPIIVFCLSPLASSISNGLGLHEGLSAVFDLGITWLVPYAVGRLYFDDLPGLRDLAAGISAGGIIYVPFCLWELARGPELHRLLFGYDAPQIDDVLRFGILRPVVFMQSGLMVAVWMASAAVLAVWLWKSHALPTRFSYLFAWLSAVLAITTLSLRSVNGWLLLAMGVGLLAIHSYWRSAAPMIAMVLLIPGYVLIRATGIWSGEQAVPVVSALINAPKGASISYRMHNENIIVANARERPFFGWGRQGHAYYDHEGHLAVWDSLWAIVFGQSGAVGLIAVLATLLVPTAVFIRRFPANRWQEASIVPATALAVVLVLYATDNLANAMINPVFMLAAGGLSGVRVPEVWATDEVRRIE